MYTFIYRFLFVFSDISAYFCVTSKAFKVGFYLHLVDLLKSIYYYFIFSSRQEFLA